MEWATFQLLRKTNASLSKKEGVDPKAASDQRGRGPGVSREVYTGSDLEQKLAKPTHWSIRSNEELEGSSKLAVNAKKHGAGDGTRTRDVQLGKLAFYR